MAYQVLARKWRPRQFTDVVGQQHVLRALINALDQQRLHHAYLLTGTRGVGKTTLGRILAKCFNCEAGISATPCGECHACQTINEGRFIDLIEVDAASRTKVEDTRELLENVQFAPTVGRFKVYLIDEVHMLSGHSFNALLKTLEEPPEHVKFILATTDPERLPVTVLSRCLQFHLKNLSPELISQYLEKICPQENVNFENAALHALAIAAKGSMRDALSLLDQAIAFGNGSVQSGDVNTLLGSIDQSYINDIMQAFADNKAEKLLEITEHCQEQGVDCENVLDDLLGLLQQIAIQQVVPDYAPPVDESQQALLKTFTTQFRPEQIQLYYQIALTGKRDLPLAPSPVSGLQMVLLRMYAFKQVEFDQRELTPAQSTPQTKNIPEHTPQVMTKNTNSAPASVASTSEKTPQEKIQPREAPTPVEAAPTLSEPAVAQVAHPLPETELDWNTLLPKLHLGGMTQALASHCSIKSWQDPALELLLDPRHAPLYSPAQEQKLTQAITQYFDKPIQLTITIAKHAQETPAGHAKKQQNAKQQQAQQVIESDENVQALLQKFSAKIAPDSVRAVEEKN